MAAYWDTGSSLGSLSTPVSPPKPVLLVRSAVFHTAPSRHLAKNRPHSAANSRALTRCISVGSTNTRALYSYSASSGQWPRSAASPLLANTGCSDARGWPRPQKKSCRSPSPRPNASGQKLTGETARPPHTMPTSQSSPWSGQAPLPGSKAHSHSSAPTVAKPWCPPGSTTTRDSPRLPITARTENPAAPPADHSTASPQGGTRPQPPRNRGREGASGDSEAGPGLRLTQATQMCGAGPDGPLLDPAAGAGSRSAPQHEAKLRPSSAEPLGMTARDQQGLQQADVTVETSRPTDAKATGSQPALQNTSSAALLSLGSVTNQISSFHLATPSSPPSLHTEPLLGDGQLQECVSMQVDEEEEFPEELEDDCSDDDTSICSFSASVTVHSSVEEPVWTGAAGSPEESPALVPSMFPLCPPTLYFSTAAETVEQLPADQRRLLKWKISSVTPNVVKHAITRSHFTITTRNHDWLGCWGHHMNSAGFKAIRQYQKLNHFPGSFQIGRKDRLWRNLSRMQARFGKKEFSFFPRSFILPQDTKLLRRAWEDRGASQKWIIKPPASARGSGIQVIHKWCQMPGRRPLLVQKYLHKPYLIDGSKFDLRVYVYVTSYDPLRIYIFSDGLVRFASCKYSSSMKSLSNNFMHLTNYSINKKNSHYQDNSDHNACSGHKWALKALWQYLSEKGVNTDLIWEQIKDIVIKTVIASEPYVTSLMKLHVQSSYSCHELFGFDILLDDKLKPWVLEVNISPSLHSNTALDVSIKGQMVRDVLNLAGFLVPQRDEVTGNTYSSSGRDKRADLSSDEKVKHAFYLTQHCSDQEPCGRGVLDVLTPGDVRVLAESEDELSRRGEFQRVFPSRSSWRYLRFWETPRYLNLLLTAWEQRHAGCRSDGISLLRSLCEKAVHLGTSDPAHMWSKCDYISRFDPQRQDLIRTSRPYDDQKEDSVDQELS